MNRRSFLKTTALAAVAVPVVGLPGVKAVTNKYPIRPPTVTWTVMWSGLGLRGSFTTPCREEAENFYNERIKEVEVASIARLRIKTSWGTRWEYAPYKGYSPFLPGIL